MEVSKTEDTQGQVGRGSANRLDWALEVAGGLELQLVGHRMDLETVEPGPGQRSRSSRVSPMRPCQQPASLLPTRAPSRACSVLKGSGSQTPPLQNIWECTLNIH